MLEFLIFLYGDLCLLVCFIELLVCCENVEELCFFYIQFGNNCGQLIVVNFKGYGSFDYYLQDDVYFGL